MGYQALLFCPDEKTARTVTQVLGELEFSVEACIEPFAAVKKLMSEHFDAVVVDCDNEQNATLLFKSARNSTQNQASLAVAVVEGQAGVAKAFRIGANLVLTKPINIEQSKGTLRVARGLLRKGEPAKPAAATAAPAASAAKPAISKPAAPARPAAPAAPSAVAAPRPPVPPAAKPIAIPAKAAAARSIPAAADAILADINVEDAVAKLSAAPASAPVPVAPAPKISVPSEPSIELTSGFKGTGSAANFGSGAASAPALARVSPPATEKPADNADGLFEKPAAVNASEASLEAPVPSFTFGGANAEPAEGTGGSKKILIAVAAAIIVVIGLYAAWASFHSHGSQTASPTPAVTTPSSVPSSSVPETAKPAAPKPTATTPSSTSAAPVPQPAISTTTPAMPSTNDNSSDDTASDNGEPSATAKPAATSSAKDSSSAKATNAPRVLKGGSVPAVRTASAAAAAPDAPPPSLIGMATPSSSAPPPNLVNSSTAAKPVLQSLNISQGVSQGLVIKKVPPTYPQNALAMHIEGAVELSATVSKSGNITAVKVISGQPLLTKAAVDAVKQWKYKPYLLNGEPVEIQTQITINFKLPH